MNVTQQRLRTAARGVLAGGAAVGLMLAGLTPAPASAATASVPPKCRIQHALYQQPVAAVVAEVEAPPDENCHVGTLSLNVWRNGVQVAAISGGPALHYIYYCVTTAPTVWRTNWDGPITLNCG